MRICPKTASIKEKGVWLLRQHDIVQVDVLSCHPPFKVQILGIKVVHEEQLLILCAARLVLASVVNNQGVRLPKCRAVFKLVLADKQVVSAESAGMAGLQKKVLTMDRKAPSCNAFSGSFIKDC